ncbi:MAG: RNA polymerase sigma factor [Actinomycetota bacterium]|nr:RNA polymerase sigma factor [Actinomycetota bacterium]
MSSAAAIPQRAARRHSADANLRVMEMYGEVDEHRLVDLARTDRAAFAEMYRRHVQEVHAFARRRTGSAHEAEDVTAATFERALRGLHQYRHTPSGLRAWLFRIATNEIIDQARRRERLRSARGQRALHVLHADSTGDADADHRDSAGAFGGVSGDPQLIAALDRLPDRYNTVLSLRFIAGLEPADVATHMGITAGNCAVLTHRALAALRKQLNEGGNP